MVGKPGANVADVAVAVATAATVAKEQKQEH